MPFCIAFDCESDSGFTGAVGTVERMEMLTRYMQPTVVCAIEVPSELVLASADADAAISACTRRAWWRDVAPEGASHPFSDMLDLFDLAEVIVTYNGLGFDFPLMHRFYTAAGGRTAEERYFYHRSKSLDLMLRIRDTTGRYFKLDNVLRDNGLAQKSGDGKQAINMWNEQRREELKAYCMDDVELTLRLALKNTLRLDGISGIFEGQVHGLRSAIAARRAAAPEEEFVMI